MLISLAMAVALNAQTVSSRQIEEAVGKHVRVQLDARGSAARWRVAPGLRDQVVPQGDLAIVVGEPVGRFPRKRAGLPVRLQVNGQPIRTVTAWIEMEDPREVWVYAADYPRGRTSSDVGYSRARVDMTCCAGEQMTSPDRVGHAQLAKAVRAGEPAMASDYVATPQVRLHQPVEIQAGSERIQVTLQGVALADGYSGDRIAVRSPNGSGSIRAVVIGEGKVRADE